MKTKEQQMTMLRSIKDFTGSAIVATDGDIGECHDFLFDDEHWTIRYLVADTRKWLPGRKVLISPYQFGPPETGPSRNHFRVDLTKNRIKESPEIDTELPVSRLHELEMARFHSYRPYWLGGGLWGTGATPWISEQNPLPPEDWERHWQELRRIEKHHLRSTKEVTGYGVEAAEDEFGRIVDFVVETASWTIRWLVVDTGGWLSGKKVIISPDWIQGVDWPRRHVTTDVPKSAFQEAPEYSPDMPVNREYEGMVCDYYGRPKYW